MVKIAAIGHATVDIFFALDDASVESRTSSELKLCIPFPTKVQVKKRHVNLGGNAVNVGVALIRGGHDVQLVSRTGEDTLGDLTYNDLRKTGFDMQYVQRIGEADNSVILFYQTDRTILSYHGKNYYRLPTNMTPVEWVYLSSLGFDDYETFHEHLFRWLGQNPKTQLLYNPSEREALGGYKRVEKIAKIAHTMILNKEEAGLMLARLPGMDESKKDDVKYMLKLFLDQGMKNIIITDGKLGAYYMGTGTLAYHMGVIEVGVADATGAGDAFASGYLLATLAGKNPVDALRYGMAQSASVIQVVGATNGLQTMAELDTMLSTHPHLEAEEI